MTTIQGTLRAFVAIELPPDVQEALRETQERIRRHMGPGADALRWARPEGLHLTLQFLGDVPIRLIGLVEGAMDKAGMGAAPFTLNAGEPGVFPNERRPRILWVGVGGDLGPLDNLASAVHRELQALGYKPDKPFSPHLTLARVRGHAGEDVQHAIAEALARVRTSAAPQVSFAVTSVSLMQSERRPGGSVYTRLRLTELK